MKTTEINFTEKDLRKGLSFNFINVESGEEFEVSHFERTDSFHLWNFGKLQSFKSFAGLKKALQKKIEEFDLRQVSEEAKIDITFMNEDHEKDSSAGQKQTVKTTNKNLNPTIKDLKSCRFTFVIEETIVAVCYKWLKPKNSNGQRWAVTLEVDGLEEVDFGTNSGFANKSNALRILKESISEGLIQL